MNSDFLQGFLAQAESYLPTIRSGILVCAQTGNTYGELNASLMQTCAIKDAAAEIELDEAALIAGELEEKLKLFTALKTPLTGEQSRGLLDKLTELEALIAQLNFNTDDFSIHITDFLDASFENLGLSEPKPDEIETAADEKGEEEFEIDEEMLEIFGEEAEELIQNIRANLELLEKNVNDREALLEVRRNAHTLKGSAGIIGLKQLSDIAHRVEDLLDFLAENEIAGNEKIFELLLTSTDCFAALASNDKTGQLTRKITQLNENFDVVMAQFQIDDAEQQPKVLTSESEQNALKFDFTGDLTLAEKLPEISNLELEIGEVRAEKDSLSANPNQFSADCRPLNEERNSKTETTKTVVHAEIAQPKSVVRVSLERLDDLVRIMSGLVVSRSVFEQRLSELEQQIGELNNSTRRLRQSINKIETDFEADMLNSVIPASALNGFRSSIFSLQSSHPKLQIPNPKSFDTLELDRYTEFHQTMRDLIETTGDTSAINSELDNLKGNLEMLFESQRHLIEEMQDKLLRLRLVSFGSLGVRLQRTIRVTADEQGKSAELVIEGENLEVDTQILDALVEPLLHLLRNAVAHGIESPETRRLLGKPEVGRIKVRVHDEGTHFILTVSDDGRGISTAALKAKAIQHGIISEERAEKMSEQEAFALIFHAGLTTAEEISQISGRGVGMNIVKNAVVRQQGTILIDSETHKGTTFTIRLPMALAVTRALLVKAGEQTFAFPLKLIKHISRLADDESRAGENWRKTFAAVQNQSTPDGDAQPAASERALNYTIFHLNELLGLPSVSIATDNATPLLQLKTTNNQCGLLVDEIIKSEEIVIKPLGNPLQNLPSLLGATILGDGCVVPVLDLMYLVKQKTENQKSEISFEKEPAANVERNLPTENRKPLNVLIVDDSPSVRHLTSNVIKNAGWTATVAKDGLEALELLQDMRETPDAILSDVEMPRMNGYELLASLKKQKTLQSVPVIMVTSRANQKHRQKAIDLGAADYLTKPFDDAKLIETIRNLII